MIRLSLTLLFGVCQAWQHFASFNEDCSGDLSLLRGTQMESIISPGKVLAQAKYAWEQVLKARVAAEGCVVTDTQFEMFFGLNLRNVIRFADSTDTTFNTVDYPAGCGPDKMAFTWKAIRKDFVGFVPPSSCTSVGFGTTKTCKFKLQLIEEFNIEVMLQDTCTDRTQAGFGLPQGTLACSGALCPVIGKPCSSNADCGAAATCDPVYGNDFSQTALKRTFKDWGLWDPVADALCAAAAYTFEETLWSSVLNRAAYLLGLTSSPLTTLYKKPQMCGIGKLLDRYVPSLIPPTFRCQSGQLIPLTQLCDGKQQCSDGDDEVYCSVNCTGNTWNPNGNGCCDACPSWEQRYYPLYCPINGCGADSGSILGFINVDGLCPPPAGGGALSCPNFLLASTFTPVLPPKPAMPAPGSSNSDENLFGWADCDGNFQFGNPNTLGGALRVKLPTQNVARELEAVIKVATTCRTGNSVFDWARYFYIWSIDFWGGLFYATESKQGVFGNINPAALLDDSFRYYYSADRSTCLTDPVYDPVYGGYTYNCTRPPPPFANLADAPASCDLASTTDQGSCELHADITSWFAGSNLGWTAPGILKARGISSCPSSSLPRAEFTCAGPCNSASKSACCFLKQPITLFNTLGCPNGYEKNTLPDTSFMTNFLLNGPSYLSSDTTLINFLNLVLSKQMSFDANVPFIAPTQTYTPAICFVKIPSFGDNTQQWVNSVFSETCLQTSKEGCPRFLGANLTGCAGSSCLAIQTTSSASLLSIHLSSALVLLGIFAM